MILARYILKEHIAPFLYALFVITFLFLVDFLIRILTSILSKGLGWKVVLEILMYNLAWILALSIPMAVLVATLMAFGRFSSDNEITAMKALGVSPFRAMGPILLVACILGAGLVYFNNRILPEANFRAAALRSDIGRKKPTALIEPRTLIKDFEGYQIWIDRLDRESGAMEGVRIYGIEQGKPVRYTFADSATMEYANAGKSIVIRLKAGENHFVDHKNPENYVRVRFKSQDVAIDNVDATLERRERSYRSDREMSAAAMLDAVKVSENRVKALRDEYQGKIFEEMKALDIVLTADSARTVPPRLLEGSWRDAHPPTTLPLAEMKRQEKDRMYLVERYERRVDNERKEISQYMVEVHKKYSIPAACLIFAFIGAPLGIMARRGGIGTGVVYSLAFYVLYWVCMMRGEAMADKLIIEPWVAMWAPNILVGIGGLFLVVRLLGENYQGKANLFQKLMRLLAPWRRA